MAKMIQLRRVPDDVYTVVKERAEQQGLSMSDFLVKELSARFGTPETQGPEEESAP
jgi:hypothetical protein